MKPTLRILLIVTTFAIASCGNKESAHDHSHASDTEAEASENQKLYDEVMAIHDEVMPKMDDIRKLKNDIKDSLDKATTLTKADKVKLEAMLARLDSAGDGMMIWMREFRPIPDSVGEEKARKYLEGEMERVKRVRDKINSALQEAQRKPETN